MLEQKRKTKGNEEMLPEKRKPHEGLPKISERWFKDSIDRWCRPILIDIILLSMAYVIENKLKRRERLPIPINAPSFQ